VKNKIRIQKVTFEKSEKLKTREKMSKNRRKSSKLVSTRQESSGIKHNKGFSLI